MGIYADYIPQRAFLVSPDYETKSVTIGTETKSRTYFKGMIVNEYAVQKEEHRNIVETNGTLSDATLEYSNTTAYVKGDRCKVEAYGVIFETSVDVPLGNHPLASSSVDANGVAYWVEAETINSLKMLDASVQSDFKTTDKSIKFTMDIFVQPYPMDSSYIATLLTEHFSILGIKGTGKKTTALIQVYHKERLINANSLSDPTNRCNVFQSAIIDEFEIDLTYRDRFSFAVPDYTQGSNVKPYPTLINGEDTSLPNDNGYTLVLDVILETSRGVGQGLLTPTICGDVTAIPPEGDLSIGLVTTGKRSEIGVTTFGMSMGRVVKRTTETNYLKRRTILSATETFDCNIVVSSPQEHLEADYFFRLASETSHIIHAGSSTFDWRFVFGVLDGNSPIDNPRTNLLSVNGNGAAFFATDPLITQQTPEGWQ